MSGYSVLGPAAAALAVACALASLALWWRRPKPVAGSIDQDFPWFLRSHWPLVIRLSFKTERILPTQLRDRLTSLIARSGLSDQLTMATLAGLQLTAALYGLMLGLIWLCVGSGRFGVPNVFGAVLYLVTGAAAGACMPVFWLRDRAQSRIREITRTLPFLLDLVTLSLEAGANLSGALAVAAGRLAAGALRDECRRLQDDLRGGVGHCDAFGALARRNPLPALISLVAALQIAQRQGASLGVVLRAQAQQARSERWLLAERKAMQAPVRMLLPLAVCIFPGTFAILMFPIAMRLFNDGWIK